MPRTRKWGTTVSVEELPGLAQARDEFVKLWASLDPPWEWALDVTANDIRAIDYLHYEGIDFPPCGISGAILVAAEALRRAAKLEWVRADSNELYLVDEDPADLVICPRARVEEIQLAGIPQFGRFAHFAVRAAIDCYGWVPGADESLRAFISELDDGEVGDLSRKLANIRDETKSL